MPPVAKVARHTPLYVWGKYNGWYRVETHDHKFGWVYAQYIETPKAYKVRAMPQSKALLASNRTSDQKVYGSPQLLKKYFASYGALIASESQKKSGIRLASASKAAQAPAKSPLMLAKMAPRTVISKTSVSKTALNSAFQNKAAAPRLASAPRMGERLSAGSNAVYNAGSASATSSVLAPPMMAPRVVSTVPRPENSEHTAPFIASAITPAVKPMVQPMVQAAVVETPVLPRVLAPALSGKMSGYVAPQVKFYGRSPVAPPASVVEPISPPREVESQRIARSSQSLTPSARFFARAAVEAASRPAPVPATTTPDDAPLTNSNFEPIPLAPPVAIIAPPIPQPKPRVVRAKPSVKSSAKKPLAKVTPKKRYATRKERQREQLRARMGMVTTAPHSVIAPVSPAELMKARQEYLDGRKARLGLPASPIETPIIGISPLPVPSGPLGGPSGGVSGGQTTELAPLPPAQFAPMSYEPTHPLAPLLGDPYILALAQMKPKLAATAAKTPVLDPSLATRGGSPRDRGLSRGGSPRDRFGAGMASQALSYRGMRYIRGAASPKRGFDCSGLVYFLLRQRGYNPPRTAAGYRGWGENVPKNQLKSGDLVLFANTYKRGVSHIGVYMGEGKFVHAATSGTGVRVSSLNERYYAGKYYGARRAQ